jgi:hypothetical protein
MTATAQEAPEVGCYDLRGPDFETALIGAVTASVIDADRLVRLEWRNGFPNWGMYRVALAKDELLDRDVRDWVIAFGLRVGEAVVRPRAYTEELACAAALDAWEMLRVNREVLPYSVVAGRLGVDPKTYKRLRDLLHRMMRASLDEYWIRLGAAYRHVFLASGRC